MLIRCSGGPSRSGARLDDAGASKQAPHSRLSCSLCWMGTCVTWFASHFYIYFFPVSSVQISQHGLVESILSKEEASSAFLQSSVFLLSADYLSTFSLFLFIRRFCQLRLSFPALCSPHVCSLKETLAAVSSEPVGSFSSTHSKHSLLAFSQSRSE